MRHATTRMLAILTVALGVSFTAGGGCTTLPEHPTGAPSEALSNTADTTLGRMAASYGAASTTKSTKPTTSTTSPTTDPSSFAILNDGESALLAERVALIDLAERSIDLQYYCWYGDRIGRLLASRLFRAADRGVRVRLLVDDVELAGRDVNLAKFDMHPNIEVRVYNPFQVRFRGGLLRITEFLSNMDTLNYRMHNKTFVVDNQIAIVGGRNVADEYFGVSPHYDYRDFDLLALGPAAATMVSGCFDAYWDYARSYPIGDVHQRDFSAADLDATRAKLAELDAQALASFSYTMPATRQQAMDQFNHLAASATTVPAGATRMLFDDPRKPHIKTEQPSQVREALAETPPQHELVLVNPYFVPQEKLIDGLLEAQARGVNVRVLTNSLASTDMVPAQSGYSKVRKQLIRGGVELYELRPDAACRGDLIASNCPDATLALHAKVMVIDRRHVFVGSLNLDPRSHRINTEDGLLIDSPTLAREVLAKLEVQFAPENSWRVALDNEGEYVWRGSRNGSAMTDDDEPDASLWRRLKFQILKMLPIGEQI